MKGLIIKDLMVLRKQSCAQFLIVGIYLVFALISGDFTIVSVILPLCFSMLTVSSLAYDEQVNWSGYCAALPIKRSTVVISRYVLSFISSLVGFAASVTISFVTYLVHGRFDVLSVILSLAGVFVGLVYIDFLVPMMIKLGVEKSRFIMLISTGVFVVTCIYLGNLFNESTQDIIVSRTLIKLMPILLIVGIIVLTALSVLLSIRLYKKKEL